MTDLYINRVHSLRLRNGSFKDNMVSDMATHDQYAAYKTSKHYSTVL